MMTDIVDWIVCQAAGRLGLVVGNRDMWTTMDADAACPHKCILLMIYVCVREMDSVPKSVEQVFARNHMIAKVMERNLVALSCHALADDSAAISTHSLLPLAE
jgi:hypothetical protein